MGRFFLGHIPIDPLGVEDALDSIAGLVAGGQGGTVFTPNVDHLLLAEESPAFRNAYAAASLSLVDGTPVLWAARLLGHHVPRKLSGSDLVLPLARRAAVEGWRLFLIGAGPGVARRAASLLVQSVPGLQVVGFDSPQIDMSGGPASGLDGTRAVRDARPHVVLVALGSPKGELWASAARGVLEPCVLVSVGAALDFLVGAQRRAPSWLSAAGLEWLYRLAGDPRRLARRYLLRGPRFGPLLLRWLWERRGGGSGG